MEYRGIIKQREKWLTALFLILAALMLWRTIVTEKWAYTPMVILVVLACFFSREHIISEEGVDIKYTLFGRFSMHNLWTWDQITTMQTDYTKAAPNVQLLIGKDVVIRPFVMTRRDLRGALALAKRMNPDIVMDEPVSEEEREEEDRRVLHRQEVERAQQQAARKKRKR
ncbi:MAG: hypothetical protein IJ128_01865 [Firmicutes bacterium]|nr:hypothetical protein [Bacillota bacterium]